MLLCHLIHERGSGSNSVGLHTKWQRVAAHPILDIAWLCPSNFMSILSYARAQDENEKPTRFHLTLAVLEKFLARTPIK